jgi:hypothetical protein
LTLLGEVIYYRKFAKRVRQPLAFDAVPLKTGL